jgi:eukaryotic-like serine/threonine-protein kinase
VTGKTISHYKILDKLGEGGMGVVYKAHDTKLDRDVAIKFLSASHTVTEQDKSRFIQEARAASALEHPHICTIHEIDETPDGRMFLVMPCYEGFPLNKKIEEKPLAIDEAITIAIQIADGLQAAHEKMIVHRDIKSSNIFITNKGQVKVMDFGLARSPGMTQVTKTGATVGTVPYMSPEQARGEMVDHRTDIWSFGVMLYEMLTGQLPFKSQYDQAVIYSIINEEPQAVSALRSETPLQVERIIRKAMEKDKAKRYQNLQELIADLKTTRVADIELAQQEKSIAVLPFTNLSADKENEYFSDGLAEEIINSLTRIPGIRVIARTSSFMVGRLGLDVREAGTRLGVESILQGSVRRFGSRVRVTAQLVSTRDGFHLWSEHYDREMTDLLALEDDVAAAIADRLRGGLGLAGGERKHQAVHQEAYVSFLEGRHHFARGTPEALMKAMACYLRAIEQDPGFALSYDSLAELYWFLGFFGNMVPRDAFSASTWNALRALELDDMLAETHSLLGMLRKELDYNWPEVERECHRALELNRQSPLVRLRYAISCLIPHGRVVEATAELDALVRLDPLSIPTRWWLAVMLYLSRQWERLAGEAQQIVSLDPNHFLGYWTLSVQRDAVGLGAEAVAALERAHELSGGIPFTLGFLAYVYGRAGCIDKARALLQKASETAKNSYVPPSVFALGHTGLNEWDAAFDWWNRAIDVRDPLVMPVKSYLFFDPVRGDPRYSAILHLMNLTEE